MSNSRARSFAITLRGMLKGAYPRRLTDPLQSVARWSSNEANDWYSRTGWLMGCNFAPSTAGNQLEMWQVETWDPGTIDTELGWAADLGMNSVRVFLHDLMWAHEGEAFLDRVDEFLAIADSHGITTMLVLFDGVWHPNPKLGLQSDPKVGVHNSMWLQSPGAEILSDKSRWGDLKEYVQAVVGRFGSDGRVDVWDLFNEPDQTNAISYPSLEITNKTAVVDDLLNRIFDWCSELDPIQPLTAGVFLGINGAPEKVSKLNRTMLSRSDVISFHSYSAEKKLVGTIEHLAKYDRPLLCTEWMARTLGSPVQLIDVLADKKVSAWSWGLVDGRSQTKYSWTSWVKRPTEDSDKWFHDLLHPDGTPYRASEAQKLRATAQRMGIPPRPGT